MYNKFAVLLILFIPGFTVADEVRNNTVLDEVHETYMAVQQFCGGISDEISRISGVVKTNTAVTAVGTVASGGALAFGIAKAQTDKHIAELQKQICERGGCNPDEVKKMTDEEFFDNVIYPLTLQLEATQELQKLQDEQAAEIKKSKRQGHWRTGLMAGGMATNIASAIIAGLNKNQSDLIQQITACNMAVEKLRTARNNAIREDMNLLASAEFKDTITNCGTINISDVEKMETRMKVVMGTSIGGAVIGAVGTGTSIAANTDSVRNEDTETGKQHEKNLNTVANVSAGLATATGVVETGFNISLIQLTKKMIETAERCEETL